MYRNQAGRSWISKAIVFSLSSSIAGLTTGILLGAVGSLLTLYSRIAIASLLAVVAIILGSLELGGRRIAPLQCNRETPQRWVHMGPLRWATVNGLALGCGATSRIGFWLWYAVPIGALLTGRPELAAVIYGTYGTVRGLAVWAVILGLSRWFGSGKNTGLWLVQHFEAARVIAAGQLVLLGAVIAFTVGL